MSQQTAFLHPEVIKRISRLDLRARHVVEGFLGGMHRSPYFGESVEFRQHREYAHGDDLRHVDWKVWAKQDRFYVKQFEEDTNLRATLLVDVSASMQYGSGPLDKYEYGCVIAASLAYMLLRQQDAVGCVAFDQSIRASVPLRTRRNHLASIIRSLDVNRPSGDGPSGDGPSGDGPSGDGPSNKTDVGRVLSEAAESYPRRGMMVLISDLLADRDEIFHGLKQLRARGHDVLVFHVMDDDELEFPFNGSTRFEGLEESGHIICNPRALREGYLAALHEHLDELRRGCSQHGIDYTLLPTSRPLDAALAAFLCNRGSGARRK